MLQQDRRRRTTSIGSGETHSVRELVEMAFAHVGLDYRKHVVSDPKFYRPAEVDLLLADPTQGAARAGLGARRWASPSWWR